MSLSPASLILVCLLPTPRDLEIARLLGWYRIPLRTAPKVIAVDYLAFYQPAAFGGHASRIELVAPVQGHELTTRGELLKDEADHPRAREECYKIQIGPLEKLSRPIVSEKWKRITFLYTTGEYLLNAHTLNDLVVDGDERILLWRSLRERAENPARPRRAVDAAVCTAGHAGAVRGRLRGAVRHEGGVRGGGTPLEAGARVAEAGAAPGQDEAGRTRRWQAGLRLPRLSPAQAHVWPDLGTGASPGLLPAALAVPAEHEARARAREGTHRPQSDPPGCPGGHRTPESDSARLGDVLPHGQRCRQVHRGRSLREVRLRRLFVWRKGRHLRPGEATRWDRAFYEGHGLYRLRGTIRYPGAA